MSNLPPFDEDQLSDQAQRELIVSRLLDLYAGQFQDFINMFSDEEIEELMGPAAETFKVVAYCVLHMANNGETPERHADYLRALTAAANSTIVRITSVINQFAPPSNIVTGPDSKES